MGIEPSGFPYRGPFFKSLVPGETGEQHDKLL